MNNAEWLVKNKLDIGSIYLVDKHDGSFKIMYQNGRNCIGEAISTTSAGALLWWLSAEHVEPILDDAEKRYLRAVIRPFRENVVSISKSCGIGFYHDWEEILVSYHDENLRNNFSIQFPMFKAGTMYKGMQPRKAYTLEELGL